MAEGLIVGDLMTRNFVHASPDDSLKSCIKAMIEERVGSIVIKERNKLVGILTQGDIVKAIFKDNSLSLTRTKARDICTKNVVTISPDKDIPFALKKIKGGYKRLPVVAEGSVVGMLTIKDILRVNPELFRDVTEMIKIKEENEKMKKFSVKYAGEDICEDCGNHALLVRFDGRLVCEECADI